MSARFVLPHVLANEKFEQWLRELSGRAVSAPDFLEQLKGLCIEVNSDPSDEMMSEMAKAFYDFPGKAVESMRAAYKVAHLWSRTAKSQQAIDTLLELGYTHSSGQWVAPDPAPDAGTQPTAPIRWLVASGETLLRLKDGTTEERARERAQNAAAQHGRSSVLAVVAKYERRSDVVEVKA